MLKGSKTLQQSIALESHSEDQAARENQIIPQALIQSNGNVFRAACSAQECRLLLRCQLQKHGLNRQDFTG
jgi:DNA-binding NtrC family response regulator